MAHESRKFGRAMALVRVVLFTAPLIDSMGGVSKREWRCFTSDTAVFCICWFSKNRGALSTIRALTVAWCLVGRRKSSSRVTSRTLVYGIQSKRRYARLSRLRRLPSCFLPIALYLAPSPPCNPRGSLGTIDDGSRESACHADAAV